MASFLRWGRRSEGHISGYDPAEHFPSYLGEPISKSSLGLSMDVKTLRRISLSDTSRTGRAHVPLFAWGLPLKRLARGKENLMRYILWRR